MCVLVDYYAITAKDTKVKGKVSFLERAAQKAGP